MAAAEAGGKHKFAKNMDFDSSVFSDENSDTSCKNSTFIEQTNDESMMDQLKFCPNYPLDLETCVIHPPYPHPWGNL